MVELLWREWGRDLSKSGTISFLALSVGGGILSTIRSFFFSLRVANEHVLQLSKNLLNHENLISPFHSYFTNKEDEGTLS